MPAMPIAAALLLMQQAPPENVDWEEVMLFNGLCLIFFLFLLLGAIPSDLGIGIGIGRELLDDKSSSSISLFSSIKFFFEKQPPIPSDNLILCFKFSKKIFKFC